MTASILFIAPYKQMAQKARRVLRALKADFPVVVGYDELGVTKVAEFPEAKILISRGGTTKQLRRYFPDKTIVDISASFTDISKGIEKLISQGCTNIAVITHENIIGSIATKISFGREKVEITPCLDREDIEANVARRIAEGADGIVGCTIAVREAQRAGVKSYFIDAEYDSIRQAVLLALTFDAGFSVREQAANQQRALIDALEEGIVIFDKERRPIYFNDNAQKIFASLPRERWAESLMKYLDGTHRHPHVISIDNRQAILHTAKLPDSDNEIAAIIQEGSFIEQSEKAMRTAAYAKGLYAKLCFEDLTFKDQKMLDIVAMARKFALSDSTVLISGETGTGKEGFAQSIHAASRRSSMPFVSVNCASLPQGLIASELFGYVEGAFTGARQSGKKGLFELAQGGTIFLDEITELPLEVQAQLLRVLQEREVMRVGDDKVIPLDIRVICACNKSLLSLCEQGRFRYDLYYRINVLKLSIPPLRQRPDDILPLFTRFVSEQLKLTPEDIEVSPEAARRLLSRTWPGNVRELRNAAEVCSFSGRIVDETTLQRALQEDNGPQEHSGLTLHLPEHADADAVMRAYLEELSRTCSISEMVEISGLSRTTVWRKLKE